MQSRILLSVLAAAIAFGATAEAQGFTIGNVVVVRVGDGSAALGAAAAPVFLDEYTATGTFVQSLALPIAPSGNQRAITVRGNATSEAYLNVSVNGAFLTMCGYDAAPGSASALTQDATATTTNRVIARIDLNGTIDTSTALTDAYSGAGGNPRSVISDDGSRFWIAGTSGTEGGVRFVANLGDTTALGLNGGSPTNIRCINVFDGQLYVSSASGVSLGINQYGDQLPTTPGQIVSQLPGFPTTGGTQAASAYDFFFADPNTLYVADDNAVASTVGGIQKWVNTGGTWTLAYRLQLGGPGASTACRGLTGFVRDGITTLWGTANTSNTGGAATQLITVTDTGPNSTVVSLATSPLNTAFRGLRFLAKPTTLQRIPAACGTAGIKVSGNGEIGTVVRTTILTPSAIPFVGYGLAPLGVPLCGCTLVTDFVSSGLLFAGATSELALPNSASALGAQVYIQGLDLDVFAAPGCLGLPLFTLTDGFTFTAQ